MNFSGFLGFQSNFICRHKGYNYLIVLIKCDFQWVLVKPLYFITTFSERVYIVEDIFSELYETKLVLDLDSFPFAPKIVAEMIATMTSTEV